MATEVKRGLFVLVEGLPGTVIESQVLMHVRLMRERKGIDFDIFALALSRSIYADSAARLSKAQAIAGSPIYLVQGWKPALPFSIDYNREKLRRFLQAPDRYSFVHARTDYAAALAGPVAKRHKIPLLWDCRGDSLAEFNARISGRGSLQKWLSPLRRKSIAMETEMARRFCDGAIFVSEALRSRMGAEQHPPCSWIVPCFAAEEAFFFDEGLRSYQRRKLSIQPEEKVFIYSGGLQDYQNFSECAAIFRRALNLTKGCARFIVMTPDQQSAKSLLADLPADRLICVSGSLHEVNAFLNAADFAFLLREDTPVNRVAFPTKFAEYCLAGLPILMKAAPASCVEIARGFGNLIGPDLEEYSIRPPSERCRIANASKHLLGREANVALYEAIYSRNTLGGCE